MRAKVVNEQQEFERGKDPKKAMNIGFSKERYARDEFNKRNIPSDLDFWEDMEAYLAEFDKSELVQIIINMLDETSPEYQMEWIDSQMGPAGWDDYEE